MYNILNINYNFVFNIFFILYFTSDNNLFFQTNCSRTSRSSGRRGCGSSRSSSSSSSSSSNSFSSSSTSTSISNSDSCR